MKQKPKIMNKIIPSPWQVNEQGYYGKFGGAFIPEMLYPNIEELRENYLNIIGDPDFQEELHSLLRDYVGRPTPLYFAKRLSEHIGAQIYLKREDLCHTGAHKINNTLGQILLAKRLNKPKIIAETGAGQHVYDLAASDLRQLNQQLHGLSSGDCDVSWRVVNPKGSHAIACGLKVPVAIEIEGHVGYYCAGMNQQARVTVHGNAGVGLAENMMSGVVRVKGQASQCAGATAHGGLLVVEGDASARCGISLKGADIVVGGSVGHMSCFMAQLGTLVVCGDAGEALGDSLYEAKLFVRGSVKSLGADCVEKPMGEAHLELLAGLLEQAEMNVEAKDFRRYGSARGLYHFHADHAAAY